MMLIAFAFAFSALIDPHQDFPECYFGTIHDAGVAVIGFVWERLDGNRT